MSKLPSTLEKNQLIIIISKNSEYFFIANTNKYATNLKFPFTKLIILNRFYANKKIINILFHVIKKTPTPLIK